MNVPSHVFSGRILSQQKINVRDIYQVLTRTWASPNAYSLQFCNEEWAKPCTSCRGWATRPSVMPGGFPLQNINQQSLRTPCFRTAVNLHWESLASCPRQSMEMCPRFSFNEFFNFLEHNKKQVVKQFHTVEAIIGRVVAISSKTNKKTQETQLPTQKMVIGLPQCNQPLLIGKNHNQIWVL